MQATVVVFVYLQVTRTVLTPLGGWLDRVLHLLR